MSADLFANAIPGNRDGLDFGRFDDLLSLARGPPDGVANSQGFMKLVLPPNYQVKVTAQSNAAKWQLVKVVDYKGKRAALFGGDGEGVAMRMTKGGPRDVIDGATEMDLGNSTEWREIGVQFAVHRATTWVDIPIINNAVLKRRGRDFVYTIVTEDGIDGGDEDFNDSSVTISLTAV